MGLGRLSAEERASLSRSEDAMDAAFALRPRGVAVSDRELLRRVQRVAVTGEFTASDALSTTARRRRGGWALERHRAGFSVLSRRAGGAVAVAAVGTLPCAAEQLGRLLRAPGESEFNALLRGAFRSRVIYGSVVHLVNNSSHGSVLPSTDPSAQLAVRTASFVHSKLALLLPPPKASDADDGARRRRESADTNDQVCVAEYFVPTPRGFVMRFCSMPDSELRVGVAPKDRVAQLHPLTGWIIAERVGGPNASRPRVRVTFRATFHGRTDDCCSTKRATEWMLRAADGVTRLGDVVKSTFHRRPSTASNGGSARSNSGIGKALGSHGGASRGGHRNWHCIACTKSLFSVLRRPWRRCDLCAYSVCADTCCSLDRVAIYNRYVAPLLVCLRCQECMDEDARPRPSGVSARSNAPSPSMAAMWTQGRTRRGSAMVGPDGRRRALSDPPFIPTLELTSSGEDNSSGRS